MKELPPIPGYDLVHLLGYGCGGVAVCSSLYLARKSESNVLVALRISNQPGHDRFPVDVAAVGRLEHPNILRVIDAGEIEDCWYEALEYVEGQTLADRLRQGPLSATQVMALGRALALALQYARDHGMIHDFLTPASIVLTEENVPKLFSFYPADSPERERTVLPGLLEYMPPECFTGPLEVTPATDVYGVGAVMYAMLTAQPPFVAGDDWKALPWQVAKTPPVPLRRLSPAVPGDLEALCTRCLEKLPQRRYATTQHLAEAIESLIQVSRP